ncbi:ABC transporter permease subunit [Mycobacterium sp. ELW1]|uniref:ABC transporter permease n=1 Tax=Mycobacterium sp. ELW1 TaxID=1547487 RepID=UPI002570689F|nr:ABC transporter permease subunit [Mycobacterium sp. ELW1]
MITTLITVPLGVLFAIGIDRWRGRLPAGANLMMLVSFVVPEVLLAVALLFVMTSLALPFGLGTSAQVIGLVTFQIAYPAVLVRARLATIGSQYEEAAMDLGASPMQALRRVTVPMLFPAIFASTVLVFADVIDDFVLVRYLSGNSATEPVSVKIYNTARAAPTPALNALATLLLVAALIAVTVGYLVYRRLTRGDDTAAAVASPRSPERPEPCHLWTCAGRRTSLTVCSNRLRRRCLPRASRLRSPRSGSRGCCRGRPTSIRRSSSGRSRTSSAAGIAWAMR